MSFDEPLAFSPEQFSGVARIFPLPNLVMFPHVMQPMHIFEPRYKSMFEEALADDRLIALGLLADGWEQQYEGRPPLHQTACLCRIATHQRTDQGTYNVLLLGVRRIQLVRELPPMKSFRLAEAEIVEDIIPKNAPPSLGIELQKRLLVAFKKVLPKIPDASEQLDQLLGNQITLGMLSDIVAYTLELSMEWKIKLLSETDVFQRTAMLLEAIAGREAATRRDFPPRFSVN